ncbi:MAG TPA: 2-phosphosulfolactate phosphatase [Ktedonobacteraceae bacterium]|nr:2-phosphosulfolactate phosphatase [Ktedonobacteraceae bacterium]
MRLNVFFTPSSVIVGEPATHHIYIVIDVIRATTTLAVIFEQGATHVLAGETLEQAQAAAQKLPGWFLCGERNVKPLPGFDYGNSPVQFSQLDLKGRELILTTTNGTRAFYACPEQSIRMAGSFYNAHAVTAKALELARQYRSDISLVCSGEYGLFALDDTVCAGYLALELQRQYEAYPHAEPLLIDESVHAAITLYRAYPVPELIEHSQSAQSVINAGLPDDVTFCLQKDGGMSVPVVVGKDEGTGLLLLERISIPARKS